MSTLTKVCQSRRCCGLLDKIDATEHLTITVTSCLISTEEISGVQLQYPPCTCIGPTINFQPYIDLKIEVDPVIAGEEKCGGLHSMEVFAWVILLLLIQKM